MINGFEVDLLPRFETGEFNFNRFIDDNFNYDFINNTCFGIKNGQNMNGLLSILGDKYAILKQLKQKMNHSRHKRMGCPLREQEMLAIMLYCNGNCDGSLSTCQRNETYKFKWPVFDSLLNLAIEHLSSYEIHHNNIYTGLTGVLLDIKKLYLECGGMELMFKTNVSFSTDLDVAIRFRGSNGIIIGVNMQKIPLVMQFKACDVSWISQFPHEKEILAQRCSLLNMYPSKATYDIKGQNQWFVCDCGDAIETSFENMFAKH